MRPFSFVWGTFKLNSHPARTAVARAFSQVNRAGFTASLENPEDHPLLREFGITAVLHPGHTEASGARPETPLCVHHRVYYVVLMRFAVQHETGQSAPTKQTQVQ